MRYEYQLIEEKDCFILVLNEEDHSIYPKEKYSRLRAECEAANEVEQARERHGENNVYYAGIFSNFEKQII